MKHLLKKGKIIPLSGGDSKQTFLIECDNQKYVLRKCPDEKITDYYVNIYKKLKKYDFLPKLYHREGKNLIFEYIEGRDCTKEDADKVSYEVGKICAIINKMKPLEHYDMDKKFYDSLKIILKHDIINLEEYNKIGRTYKKLVTEIKPKTMIDANDVYPENFRLRNGKIYFVDIEAIKPRLKGRGIAKAFSRWFRTLKTQNKFWKGYKSVLSNRFWTPKYQKLAEIYFLIPTIRYQIEGVEGLKDKDVKRLKELSLKPQSF